MPAEPPTSGAAEQLRGLLDASDQAWNRQEVDRQGRLLKEALTFARENLTVLTTRNGSEVADLMDRAAFGLYRLSLNDVALEAVDLALTLNPNLPSALQHKGIILLAMNQNLDQVLPLLDRALGLNPQDKNLWAGKGDALKLMGRPEEAVQAYLHAQQLDATSTQFVDRALKLVPGHPEALRMKLAHAMALGGVRQATEVCDQLLQTNPGDAELHFTRASLLASASRFDEALPAVDRALELNASEPRFRFLRARLLLAVGRYAEAFALYRTLLEEKVVADPTVLADLAETLETQKLEPALALEARRRLAVLDPGNVANLQRLLALARDQGRKDVAQEACQAWLKASPHALEPDRTLAELLASGGQVEEALKVYQDLGEAHPQEAGELRKGLELARAHRRAPFQVTFARALLRLRPNDPEVAVQLAQGLFGVGQGDAALQVYEQLLASQPDHVPYLLEKKRILQALGRVDQIPPLLDRLFEVDPSRQDIALERGNLYLSRSYRLPPGDPGGKPLAQEALRSYERSVVSPELRSSSLLGQARASHLLGDLPRAIQGFHDFLAEPANAQRGDVFKEYGHVLREAHRDSEAHMAYERAVALGREDSDLLFGLVEVLSALNEDARALHYVDVLLKREPSNSNYLRRRGRLLMRTGQKAQGLELLRASVSSQETDPRVFFEVGASLKEQGDYPEALDYLKKGLSLAPQDPYGQRALAESLLLAGRYPEAATTVDTLLRQDPHDPAAWKLRADAYRALRREPEVIYSLKALLLLDPGNVAVAQEKYRLHRERGERLEALDTLQGLLKQVPDGEPRAALGMAEGDLLSELGRPAEAVSAYDRALAQSDRLGPEIAFHKSRTLLESGQPQEALEALGSMGGSGTPPDGARTFAREVLRSRILLALDRAPEALPLLEKLVSEHSDDPEPAALYLRALVGAGEADKASSYFESNPNLLTPLPEAYLAAADAALAKEDPPRATALLQQGVARHPRSVALWARRAEVAQRAGDDALAAEAFGKALELAPQDPQRYVDRGTVQEKLGRFQEALSTYDQGLGLASRDKVILARRGSVLLELRRAPEALASFEEALRMDPELEAAVEGKKLAEERVRDEQVERYGKEALVLEAKLGRPVAKNDLFLTLKVPFDLLEPVTRALSRTPEIEIRDLSPEEFQRLESQAKELVLARLTRNPAAGGSEGLSLSEVAALLPPERTLSEVQRLFAYLGAVLALDMRPDNVTMTPEVEELARRALTLPPGDRGLYQLVRTFGVGPYKARLIKVVEEVGGASHAPSAILRASPGLETGGSGRNLLPPPPSPSPSASAAPGPLSPPLVPVPGPTPGPAAEPLDLVPAPPGSRCESCGGLAQWKHRCGALICASCVTQFQRCPRCSLPVTLEPARPVSAAGAVAPPTPSSVPSPSAAEEPKKRRRGLFGRKGTSQTDEPRL